MTSKVYKKLYKTFTNNNFAFRILHYALLYLRAWRNWQTRKIQVLMAARLCGFKSRRPHQKSRIILIRLFYPLRSNGISSPHEVWWISSALRAVYHHALACIKLRNDEILARKRDILVFGRMISSHFVPDDIHFLQK